MSTTRLVVVVFGLSVLATPVFAQTARLEHFQCYAVVRSEPPLQVPVFLTDQFDTAANPQTVFVTRAFRFCNPTDKFHRNQFFPIADDRQHLTFYATFPQTGPVRVVAASNQFDPAGAPQQLFWLGDPVALAVPTHKPPHNRPEGLDHFKCYQASGNQVFEVVGLRDQFLPPGGRLVLTPRLFCNPVKKQRLDTGEVTEILNPDQHLTCYATSRAKFDGSRDVINQFGVQVMAFGPTDMLCVPTKKLGWIEIPDDLFGATGAMPQP
jgi:hypothetical protein